MARIKGQNIPSELKKLYAAGLQPAATVYKAWTNRYNTIKYNQTKYRGSYYVRMRYPFKMVGRRGRDDIHSATVKQIASPTPYAWRRKKRGTPSAAQLWVRNTFCKGAACFREQPKTGYWDGVSSGPRGRDWWYELSLGTGLYYYPNFMSKTLKPLFQTTIPSWCPSLAITSITPNRGFPDIETPVDIYGSGFDNLPQSIKIGTTSCTDIIFIDSTHLQATVPSGISIGTYDVIITNQDDEQTTLYEGFTVGAPSQVALDGFLPQITGLWNGTTFLFVARHPGNAHRSLIRWTNNDQFAQFIWLYSHGVGYGFSETIIQIHRILSPWDSSITKDTQPNYSGPVAQLTFPGGAASINTWQRFFVGPPGPYGFMLRYPDPEAAPFEWIQLGSKEDPYEARII